MLKRGRPGRRNTIVQLMDNVTLPCTVENVPCTAAQLQEGFSARRNTQCCEREAKFEWRRTILNRQEDLFDGQLVVMNRRLAAAALLSILFWLIEFFIVSESSQPTCEQVFRYNVNPYSLWHITYPRKAFIFQALYTICTVFIFFTIIRLYMVNFEARTSKFSKQKTRMPWSVFFRSKFFPLMILELLVTLLQPMPFINIDQEPVDRFTTPTGDDPNPINTWTRFRESQVNFGIFMFVRMYLIVRFLRDHTDIYSKRKQVQRLGLNRIHDVQFNWRLTVRVLFENYSARTTTSIFAFVVLIFSFSFYAAEWNNCGQIKTDGCKYGHLQTFDIQKAFYLTIVTLTTVGYGDVIPASALGRVCCSLCAVCGLFSSALIISSFFRWLELKDSELCVKCWCDAKFHQKNQEEFAALIIQKFWNSLAFRKKQNRMSLYLKMSGKTPMDVKSSEEELVVKAIRHFYKLMQFHRIKKEISFKLFNDLGQELGDSEKEKQIQSEILEHGHSHSHANNHGHSHGDREETMHLTTRINALSSRVDDLNTTVSNNHHDLLEAHRQLSYKLDLLLKSQNIIDSPQSLPTLPAPSIASLPPQRLYADPVPDDGPDRIC